MQHTEKSLFQEVRQGQFRGLARIISHIENDMGDYRSLLSGPAATTRLDSFPAVPILGITGPPGAGKSTLVDALIGEFLQAGRIISVLCVDPSSSIHSGALLGDRIRMSRWYADPRVFIRSLSSRGALGGLHPKIPEITDLLRVAGFDLILIETVGVGQTEIEIAGLADTTLVVLVPEAGDEIQAMKAGLMEIADIFVVNKCDRPGADLFIKNLRNIMDSGQPIIKTNALLKEGLPELVSAIEGQWGKKRAAGLNAAIMADRAYYLIRDLRMKDIRKDDLVEKIEREMIDGNFNLYRFVSNYSSTNDNQ
jgi:LAO/AO transport system kinase